MSTRKATLADIDGLVDVHIASWKVAYKGLMPDEVLENISPVKRRENWDRNLRDSKSQTVIYEQDARVVGFASFGPSRDDDADNSLIAELMGLYVHPDAWRRGIGRTLWVQVEIALVTKFKEVTVWLLRDNEPAKEFYQAMGFTYEEGRDKLLPWYDCALYEARYRKFLESQQITTG